MLGGYGFLSNHKLITVLPLASYNFTHVKVEATVHFLDAWAGQYAYLSLPKTGMYLWTDNCDFTLTKNSLSICGTDVAEVKFATAVEAVFPRSYGVVESDGSLIIEFGSTLDTDPFYASYGISEFRVYVK
jgi:hypothetical protein